MWPTSWRALLDGFVTATAESHPHHASSIEEVIDTDRYPIVDREGRAELVAHVRAELADDGCCVLPDMVRPAIQPVLGQEGAAIAPAAHFDVETVNVYNTEPDPSLPAGHPARIELVRGNAFVARDRIPSCAVIHRLYVSALFQRFVADCFGLSRVHPLADPYSGLCLNVVSPGRAHPWHFDTNEFTVSMLTQEAESGGEFQYCPDIRSAGRENVDDVRAVLDGRAQQLVKRIDLRPGALQLFRGRYSLHRVTAVTGRRDRHTAIFAYSRMPGVIGTAARTMQLFGRVSPAHLAAEAARVRGDKLMD